MLGAFRWMVKENDEGRFVWRTSFDEVLELWKDVCAERYLGWYLNSAAVRPYRSPAPRGRWRDPDSNRVRRLNAESPLARGGFL
jgi:hypothetical protein